MISLVKDQPRLDKNLQLGYNLRLKRPRWLGYLEGGTSGKA
jgi:hypothetical protein